jgi:hypothetical protein
MNTVGTSCVLITTRLKQKESQNQNAVSVILSVADQSSVDNAG